MSLGQKADVAHTTLMVGRRQVMDAQRGWEGGLHGDGDNGFYGGWMIWTWLTRHLGHGRVLA